MLSGGSFMSVRIHRSPEFRIFCEIAKMAEIRCVGVHIDGLVETRFHDIFNFFIKITEKDHGSIENGSAASDLPPEGSKKKRWADLAHLAHFGNLAHFSGFRTQKSELRP